MFVVLEGIDGSGKSTLCSILADKINGALFATPPEKYRSLRIEVDKSATADEHYQFYLSGLQEASDEIKTNLEKGKTIVCDRYWLSTYTSHKIMGANVSLDDFHSIVMPDLTVVLSLGRSLQIKRLLQRGLSVGDKRSLNQQQEVALSLYQSVMEFSHPFIVLDTGKFPPDACAEIVVKALEFTQQQ